MKNILQSRRLQHNYQGISGSNAKSIVFELKPEVEYFKEARNFCFLYSDSKKYTVAWDGIFNFEKLGQLLSNLPRYLFNKDISIRRYNSNINATLVHSNTEYDQLFEFYLRDNEQYADYLKAIENQSAIAFARFDIQDKRHNIEYSVTVENSKFLGEKDYHEIAIRQPLSQKLTESTLYWIILHHRQGEYYIKNLDVLTTTKHIWESLKN